MRKTKILLTIILLLITTPNTSIYAIEKKYQGNCEPCFWQFSMMMDMLQWEYTQATAYQCTPVFGTDNSAGLSDTYDYLTEGAGGVGAIFTGLDMASSYWACIDNLEQDFYRGIDALTTSLEQCLRQAGCEWWGY